MKRLRSIAILVWMSLGGCATPEVGSPQWLYDEARKDFEDACIARFRYTTQPLAMTVLGCGEASWRAYPPRR